MNEVISLIAAYNVDPANEHLLEYYNSDNIWRTLRIERDENKHSDFLKWLFEKDPISALSPMRQLLNILVKRDNKGKIKDEVKNAILLNKLRVDSVSISREKCISDLSCIHYPDRIDLFIECYVSGVNDYKKLEIIIENKINSTEGDKKTSKAQSINGNELTIDDQNYAKEKQTTRYYEACRLDGNWRKKDPLTPNTAQLFVYLSTELDSIISCDGFIRITYQDLVDYILEPQLNRDSIDEYTRVMIDKYLHNMAQPIGTDMTVMATTNEEKELLMEFFKRNEQLFLRAAEVAKDKVDSDIERESLDIVVKSLKAKKKVNRYFSINGAENKYRMYEVIAQFVIWKNKEQNATLQDINGELAKEANQRNRIFVSFLTNVYRAETHFHEDKLNDGSVFYVTKELAMGSPKDNFSLLYNYFNKHYKSQFEVKVISNATTATE